MKKNVKLTGMLLMLILACSLSLSAQRGNRGTIDSIHMKVFRMTSDTIHRHAQGEWLNPYRMRGMRPGTDVGHMGKRGYFPDHDRMNGMGQGKDRQSFADVGQGMRGFKRGGHGPVDYKLESIPNVTEKQKKDIADLRQKQQEEMKIVRDDMSARMQAMRDSYKKSMMSILTDEQKKFIESKHPETTVSPAKIK
jgi:hypothetical protein